MPRKGVFRDVYGQKFNRLIVVSGGYCKYPKAKRVEIFWKCLCTCGGTVSVLSGALIRGNTTSCGCEFKERLLARITKHGKYGTRLYRIWIKEKERCSNPNEARYRDYGGRGISFHKSFKDFNVYEAYLRGLYPNLDELMDKKYQVDRIDNDKGYEPGNLRLVTCKENANNTRNNTHVFVFGKRYTLSQVEETPFCIVTQRVVGDRLKKGLHDYEAVLLPKLPPSGKWSYKEWAKNQFPNDITLEEALAPVTLPILGIELKELARSS